MPSPRGAAAKAPSPSAEATSEHAPSDKPADKTADKPADAARPCGVTVTGFDRGDVLFESDQVGAVIWRDADSEPVALLVRLRPEIWGFSRRGDADWGEVLSAYLPGGRG